MSPSLVPRFSTLLNESRVTRFFLLWFSLKSREGRVVERKTAYYDATQRTVSKYVWKHTDHFTVTRNEENVIRREIHRSRSFLPT